MKITFILANEKNNLILLKIILNLKIFSFEIIFLFFYFNMLILFSKNI